MDKYCTCLSISRDPYCIYHGDVDKVAIMMKRESAALVKGTQP